MQAQRCSDEWRWAGDEYDDERVVVISAGTVIRVRDAPLRCNEKMGRVVEDMEGEDNVDVVEDEWGGRRKNLFVWVREGPNIIWGFSLLPAADFCLGVTMTLADADYKGTS